MVNWQLYRFSDVYEYRLSEETVEEISSDDDPLDDDDKGVTLAEKFLKQKKCIAFEQNLHQLLRKIQCRECGASVQDFNEVFVGSMVTYNLVCLNRHLILRCSSQPYINQKLWLSGDGRCDSPGYSAKSHCSTHH